MTTPRRADMWRPRRDFLLANGFGAIIGPILAATLMEATSNPMLFLFTALWQLGLAAFALARIRTRAAMPTAEKTDFDFAATAAVGTVISPEPLDPADDLVLVPGGVTPEAMPPEAPAPPPAASP